MCTQQLTVKFILNEQQYNAFLTPAWSLQWLNVMHNYTRNCSSSLQLPVHIDTKIIPLYVRSYK
jgi:hypothetical protein